MLLPWKEATVLDSVVRLAISARLKPIAVVTGAFQQPVHEVLSAYAGEINEIHNPAFAQQEMFYSLKMGIAGLSGHCNAACVFLGDQPQIEMSVIEQILRRFKTDSPALVIPSHQMRRGHPILIRSDLFAEILAMPDDDNLKNFLRRHAAGIAYVIAGSNSILEDIDSPEDYARIKKNQNR